MERKINPKCYLIIASMPARTGAGDGPPCPFPVPESPRLKSFGLKREPQRTSGVSRIGQGCRAYAARPMKPPTGSQTRSPNSRPIPGPVAATSGGFACLQQSPKTVMIASVSSYSRQNAPVSGSATVHSRSPLS